VSSVCGEHECAYVMLACMHVVMHTSKAGLLGVQVAGGVVLAILFVFIFIVGPPSGPPSSS
jgi:hypothetical protein